MTNLRYVVNIPIRFNRGLRQENLAFFVTMVHFSNFEDSIEKIVQVVQRKLEPIEKNPEQTK